MVNLESNVKNQHYVWQHYLKAWAAGGTFCCYRHRDGKLFLTQPKAIASETYFYETEELTVEDVKYLEDFISKTSDERLRKLNRDYVRMGQLSFKLRERLNSTQLPLEVRIDVENRLRWAERNLGERHHTGIEQRPRHFRLAST